MWGKLAGEYNELFAQLDNGQRTGNAARDMNAICNARPTWGRNEANGFQVYAIERALGESHDAAMQEVNSLVWR